jgi:hypothetical protein
MGCFLGRRNPLGTAVGKHLKEEMVTLGENKQILHIQPLGSWEVQNRVGVDSDGIGMVHLAGGGYCMAYVEIT